MAHGTIAGIFICPTAGGAMQSVETVLAITGAGLQGDRYCTGEGSFNKGKAGKNQVTLINTRFFPGSGFTYAESRRNIVTQGVELLWLIGREFQIGAARMKGVKYCEPCNRPSKLSGKKESFQEAFFDCGGIIAEVLEDGLLRVNDLIIPPPKGY